MNPLMPEYRRLAAEDPAELVRRLARAESELERVRRALESVRVERSILRRQLRRARGTE